MPPPAASRLADGRNSTASGGPVGSLGWRAQSDSWAGDAKQKGYKHPELTKGKSLVITSYIRENHFRKKISQLST